MSAVIKTKLVDPRTLAPHPENYQVHPPEQLEHLRASIRESGFFRNVVVASDGVILAGHGAVEAALAEELRKIPAAFVDYPSTDPRAKRILVADNEIGRLAERDETRLAALLAELAADDASTLVGTGYTLDDVADLRKLLERAVPEPPSEFPSIDPGNVRVQYHCPSCGYEWSGSPTPGDA